MTRTRIRSLAPAAIYIARRILTLAAALVAISFLVFTLSALAPGSTERAMLGARPASPQLLAAIRAEYHLDDPFFERFWYWLRGALQLQLGSSSRTQEPVRTAIAHSLPPTAQLVALGAILMIVIGLPLGVLAAVRQGSPADRLLVGTSVVSASTPIFVIAVILLVVFGVHLRWFPLVGVGGSGLDRLWHLILPALSLSLIGVAYLMKVTRAAVAQCLERDYVDFARARGVPTRRIMTSYVLRNAAIPIVTAAALGLVSMIAGTILVEVPFSINGLGSLLQKAIAAKDVSVVQGIALLIAGAILVVNLLVDLSYAFLDPRVRLGGR